MILRRFVTPIMVAFLVFCAPLALRPDPSTWSGAGSDNNWTDPANWQDNTTPATGADVTLDGSSASSNRSIHFDASPSINSLSVSSDYSLDGPATLTIGTGGLTVGDPAVYSSSLGTGSCLPITLNGSQTWTIGSVSGDLLGQSHVNISGNITGDPSSFLTVTVQNSSSLSLGGNNSLTGSFTIARFSSLTLAGNNTFGDGSSLMLDASSLMIGSSSALPGNVALAIANASVITNYSGSDLVLPNPVTLNAGSTSLLNGSNLFTLSGPITLKGPSILSVFGSAPAVISGTLGETGGPQSIAKSGSGMLVVTGPVDLTGGMSVNDGLMILGTAPGTGTALPAPGNGTVGVYGAGYLGVDLATTGISPTGYINRLDSQSYGTIGFDSATLSSPAIVNDTIDLSGFSNAGGRVRLGSATSAVINGPIVPGAGGYQFGGGGGTLKVTSNLTDGSGATGLTLGSPAGENQSLMLILSGTNTYSGGTSIDNSLLQFPNANALPSSGNFSFNSRGYLGLGFAPGASGLQDLWGRTYINTGDPVVLGFDTPLSGAVSISTDTLRSLPSNTDFGNTAYLGTSTAATIAITQGNSSMPAAPGFAAVQSGHLTIASLPGGEYGLILGLPNDTSIPDSNYPSYYDSPARGAFATPQSTVELATANNYFGGTTIQGGTVILDDPGALGTGAISVTGNATLSTMPIDGPFDVANGINTSQWMTLNLDATNSFTLSGVISGPGAIDKIGAGTLTLSGNNTYTGGTTVDLGTLADGVPYAFSSDSATAVNSGGYLRSNFSEVIGGLSGSGGVYLNDATTLTIKPVGDYTFSGVMTGNGVLAINGSGTETLTGANAYYGGTTVNNGTLAVNCGSIYHPSAALIVGDADGDNGMLAITNVGVVTSSDGYIGSNSGSTGTVTVDGTGSTWTTSGYLVVGNHGTAALTIANGGSINSGVAQIGSGSGGSGTATITGSGSSWTTSDMLVGGVGSGTLTIADSGFLNVGGRTSTVTLGWTGAGILNIGAAATDPAAAGGIVNASTITTASGTGTIQFNTTACSCAPYYFTNDGTRAMPGASITGSTQLINTAGYNVLTGVNTYTGSTTINGGTLEFDNSVGTGSIPGDILDDSALVFNGSFNNANVISGTGTVAKTGTGLLTLSGANTYARRHHDRQRIDRRHQRHRIRHWFRHHHDQRQRELEHWQLRAEWLGFWRHRAQRKHRRGRLLPDECVRLHRQYLRTWRTVDRKRRHAHPGRHQHLLGRHIHHQWHARGCQRQRVFAEQPGGLRLRR